MPMTTIAELTEQVSQLTSMIQASLNSTPPTTTQTAFPTSTIPQSASAIHHVPRCIFCDTTEHSQRSRCPHFANFLRKGLVYLNAKNHVVNALTGEEIPPMFGHGGIMKVFEYSQQTAKPTSQPVNNALTLDTPQYGYIGNVIDVDVY